MQDEEPTQDDEAETGAGDREVQGADAQECPTVSGVHSSRQASLTHDTQLASDDEEYEYESGQWRDTNPETSVWETGMVLVER